MISNDNSSTTCYHIRWSDDDDVNMLCTAAAIATRR